MKIQSSVALTAALSALSVESTFFGLGAGLHGAARMNAGMNAAFGAQKYGGGAVSVPDSGYVSKTYTYSSGSGCSGCGSNSAYGASTDCTSGCGSSSGSASASASKSASFRASFGASGSGSASSSMSSSGSASSSMSGSGSASGGLQASAEKAASDAFDFSDVKQAGSKQVVGYTPGQSTITSGSVAVTTTKTAAPATTTKTAAPATTASMTTTTAFVTTTSKPMTSIVTATSTLLPVLVMTSSTLTKPTGMPRPTIDPLVISSGISGKQVTSTLAVLALFLGFM